MANGVPFGDIYSVSTPHLDRMGQQLYAQQLQREAGRQQQIAAMDNEFSKNVANIRDADVGDVSKAYGDWKLATQQLMKKKNATPQEQLDVLRKKADMYKTINDSKADKEAEEYRAKRYVVKPDDFTDEAGKLITVGRSLPISQKRAYKVKDANGNETTVDLTNDENYLYRDKTDWQKILGKAEGTLSQRGVPVEESLPGGLETKVTTYKAKNSPLDFYNSIKGSMTTARAAESLANRYKFTPEEAQVITDEFNLIKETPAFKAVYGKVDFPESDNQIEGLRTAKLLAMQHAIHNQPTSSFVNKPNKEAITKEKNSEWDRRNEKTYGQSVNKIYLNASLQGKGGGNYSVADLQLPDGNTDLTKPLQGIKVSGTVTGKSFQSDNMKYNPQTKQITYHDVIDDKDYTVPAPRFRQIISTINTVQDLKTFDNVIQNIDKAFQKPVPKPTGRKKITW